MGIPENIDALLIKYDLIDLEFCKSVKSVICGFSSVNSDNSAKNDNLGYWKDMKCPQKQCLAHLRLPAKKTKGASVYLGRCLETPYPIDEARGL